MLGAALLTLPTVLVVTNDATSSRKMQEYIARSIPLVVEDESLYL
jgi:hypothetical protein